MFSRLWTNHKAETDKCKIQLGILTLVWPTTAGYWMFIFYLGLSFPLLLFCHPRQCLPLILLFGFFINGLDPQIPADPSRKVWRNWIVMMRDGVDTARRGHQCNMLWHFSQTIAPRSIVLSSAPKIQTSLCMSEYFTSFSSRSRSKPAADIEIKSWMLLLGGWLHCHLTDHQH